MKVVSYSQPAMVSILYSFWVLFMINSAEGFSSINTVSRMNLVRHRLDQTFESSLLIHRNRDLVLFEGSSESEGNVNAYPDSRRKIAELKIKVDANLSKDVMNVAMLKESIRDMEQESSQPGFWDSQEKAQDLLTEMNRVKALVERVEYWKSSCDDIELLLDMAAEDPDEAAGCLDEVLKTLRGLEKDLDGFEVERLLSGKYDKFGCTLCIQSGAGGTEAMDWAGMLFRMYKRFAERRGFKITIMEEIPADFGIKSVEMRIEGPFAYGYLSGEKGTHRLVRISPFNAQGKRQTSFAGIETWPILEEKEMVNIDIPDKVLSENGIYQLTHSLFLVLSFTLTHTYSLSHSHTNTRSLSLTLSPTHSLLSLFLTYISHTHTHTHTHTHSLTLSHSLSPHTRTHTHTNTHSLSLSLLLTLSLPLSQ